MWQLRDLPLLEFPEEKKHNSHIKIIKIAPPPYPSLKIPQFLNMHVNFTSHIEQLVTHLLHKWFHITSTFMLNIGPLSSKYLWHYKVKNRLKVAQTAFHMGSKQSAGGKSRKTLIGRKEAFKVLFMLCSVTLTHDHNLNLSREPNKSGVECRHAT